MTRTWKAFAVGIGSALALGGAAFFYLFKTRRGFRTFHDAMYRREFGDVPLIEPENLAAEMEGVTPPLLLDVRSPEEYAVSHLRNAQLANPETFDLDELEDIDRERTIITYCTTGYRSSHLTRELLERGFTDVRNLYGGIFNWYNQGLPVYRGSSLVEEVHPYGGLWGQFLTRAGKHSRVEAPSEPGYY